MNKKILLIAGVVLTGVILSFTYVYLKNDAQAQKEYLLLKQQKQTLPSMQCYVDCAQKDFSEYKKCINDMRCEELGNNIK